MENLIFKQSILLGRILILQEASELARGLNHLLALTLSVGEAGVLCEAHDEAHLV